ncbi:TPA: ABC transporter permease [Candidatus Woesearchaeota archaeon]|nr:ABC transporter permease [Candidatus Woesearchaeota archaeon]
MLFDYFKIAFSNLIRRKLRAWLTVIGIFIGIMAVVALVSLSQGLEGALLDEFKKLGTDRIVLSPGGAAFGPVGGFISPSKFYESDYDVVSKIRGIEMSAAVYAETAYITHKRETKQQLVWGFSTDSESIAFYKTQSMFDIGEGRFLRSGDKYKAIIGWEVANEWFDDDIKVGNTIYINARPFQVVGIHEKKGGMVSSDDVIRIPKDTAREIFNEPNEVTAIFVKVREGFNVDSVADNIKRRLRKHRDVKEGEEDFTVQTSAQVIQSFETVLGVVQAVLVGLAAISLLVGGIGIMNTMYTSVVERTKEIGIMKSVGARNSAIMWIFLIESGLLGVVGGVLGVFLGLGIGKSAELVALQFGIESLKAYMGVPLIVGALLFSFVVGAVAGTLPALQAAKMHPVEALRK